MPLETGTFDNGADAQALNKFYVIKWYILNKL